MPNVREVVDQRVVVNPVQARELLTAMTNVSRLGRGRHPQSFFARPREQDCRPITLIRRISPLSGPTCSSAACPTGPSTSDQPCMICGRPVDAHPQPSVTECQDPVDDLLNERGALG
ncbi:hypothetical protein [Streptosporangium sp. NPDC049644]|uniref:hypothetical protein n=1 Tax=Streptosporangium sp. NPDC049644 TaxID=3155507 RepID=UPI00344201E7